MKSAANRIKRIRPATVIAMLALFVAVGGTATAASGLINGKKLKNNSVPGKKLKNKTVTKNKLAPATVKALKGQQGKQGEQGPQGPQGPKGEAGEDGVVTPHYIDSGNINIPASNELAVATLSVPAGKYMVTSNVGIVTNATNATSCGIVANNGGGENSSTYDNDGGGRTTIPVQMVTGEGVTSITLACTAGNAVAGVQGDILAVPVR